ncbi:MAG: lipocalin-like domain-containing protein [Alphaproteobacteria bacterium]|nr:lipocalin-like domain-containing protein [Alphaproteobacteria bacterium]
MTIDGQSLIGTWEMVRWETRYDDGRVIFPMGEDAQGQLLYTADGHMAAFLMRRGRPRFTTGEALTASAEEKIAAWNSFYAYAGRYRIAGGDTIIHTVEASMYPNWVGDEQRRLARFEDGQLVLTTPPQTTKRGVQRSTIWWRRPRHA